MSIQWYMTLFLLLHLILNKVINIYETLILYANRCNVQISIVSLKHLLILNGISRKL